MDSRTPTSAGPFAQEPLQGSLVQSLQHLPTSEAAARTSAGNASSFIGPRQQSYPSQTARPSSKKIKEEAFAPFSGRHLCRSQAPCPFAFAHQNRLFGSFRSHVSKVDSNLWQLSLRRNHVRRHTTTSFDTTLSPRTISSVTRGIVLICYAVSASQALLALLAQLPPFHHQKAPDVRLLFSSTSISIGTDITVRSTMPLPLPSLDVEIVHSTFLVKSLVPFHECCSQTLFKHLRIAARIGESFSMV